MGKVIIFEEENGLVESWVKRSGRDRTLDEDGSGVVLLVHFVLITAESGILEELKLLLN